MQGIAKCVFLEIVFHRKESKCRTSKVENRGAYRCNFNYLIDIKIGEFEIVFGIRRIHFFTERICQADVFARQKAQYA